MITRAMLRNILGVLFACALLAPAPAAAQGNGRGHANGHNKRPSTSPPAASASSPSADGAGPGGAAYGLQPDGAGVRNFGSWLDDASVMTPGAGFTSFAVGYWRMPGFTEFDFPSVDAGVGLTRRIQVGVSVPVYHAGEPGGPIARGVGDLFLSTKIQLRDPAAGQRRIGFAVVPVLEVHNAAPAPGTSRFSWGLPATVELQRQGWRAYGSAGYFSRGAVFGSGAVEFGVGTRLFVTGTISESRSIRRDDLSEALGLSKTRRDISASTTVILSERIAAFGTVGRTISTHDWNSATVFVTGGLSISFQAWKD